jgi:hypothetical protein
MRRAPAALLAAALLLLPWLARATDSSMAHG